MADVVLFHNPRCKKSREALRLLEERGVRPVIVEYLKAPPDEKTLRDVIRKLGVRPKDVVRRGEPAFEALRLSDRLDDDEAVVRALLGKGALPPRLASRPLPRRLRRARSARVVRITFMLRGRSFASMRNSCRSRCCSSVPSPSPANARGSAGRRSVCSNCSSELPAGRVRGRTRA